MIVAHECPNCRTRYTVPADETWDGPVLTDLSWHGPTLCPVCKSQANIMPGLPPEIQNVVERLGPKA